MSQTYSVKVKGGHTVQVEASSQQEANRWAKRWINNPENEKCPGRESHDYRRKLEWPDGETIRRYCAVCGIKVTIKSGGVYEHSA